MEKRLSKDEMDALLSPPGQGSAPAGASAAAVMVYDFTRPDRISKTMIESLRQVHDSFCSDLQSALTSYLRTATEVQLESIDQVSYGEFINTFSDPPCIAALNMSPSSVATLQLDLELVFPLIDRLTGGSGAAGANIAGRKITEIEQTIIGELVEIVTKHLTTTWRSLDTVFTMKPKESRPQLSNTPSPSEPITVLAFEIKLDGQSSHVRLCIPYTALEKVRSKFEQDTTPQPPAPAPADVRNIFTNLLKAPLTITADLPPTMVKLRDLLELSNDDILTLDTKIDDCIRISIARLPSFEAKLVRVNRHKTAKVVGVIPERRRKPR